MTAKTETNVKMMGTIEAAGASHHSGVIESRVRVYEVDMPQGWYETVMIVESSYWSKEEDERGWDWKPVTMQRIVANARGSEVTVTEIEEDSNEWKHIASAIEVIRDTEKAGQC